MKSTRDMILRIVCENCNIIYDMSHLLISREGLDIIQSNKEQERMVYRYETDCQEG